MVPSNTTGASLPAARPVVGPIAASDLAVEPPRSTGVRELDRLLDGGLVDGSVTLVGGEPGIGKSTLLLQVLAGVAAGGRPSLLVSAEESADQVRSRADRLGALRPRLSLCITTDLADCLSAIESQEPAVVVVDSIQTLAAADQSGAPGSVAQVRECAHRLVEVAKRTGTSVLVAGHVTKDGSLAGPRVLEHVVDTVLAFEGDRHHALRLLRATKHRFGATGEVAVFEMTDSGLRVVDDPSSMFLADRRPDVAGSVVVGSIDGNRPFLAEVQGLAVPSGLAQPRRTTQGVDPARVALVLAAAQRWTGVPFGHLDVWVSVAGGVKVIEPGADLAIAIALASSLSGTAVSPTLVTCAEVGLAGELRQVAHTRRRLVEAQRCGFIEALVPLSAPDPPPGLTAVRAASLSEALTAVGCRASDDRDVPRSA
jgi:DNA repair protein RadA/Sms